VMQNKTVRFVKKLGPRTRINYLVFSDVGILNIENKKRVLNIWDKISVKREIYIITQQRVRGDLNFYHIKHVLKTNELSWTFIRNKYHLNIHPYIG
jgi:hypothetical protein